MTRHDISELRQTYLQGGLNETELAATPMAQFHQWFTQAQDAELLEPNAMTLSTLNEAAYPSCRTVLLKYYDEEGLVFFTNYKSQKAKDIAMHPKVGAQFLWLPLERQINLQGQVEKISLNESMHYFQSRPRGSQIGAWVSHQSEIIHSRKLLQAQFESMKQKFKQGQVPFPDFWGGYRIKIERMEFWQGGENRLHDRLCYQAQDDGWEVQRLSP